MTHSNPPLVYVVSDCGANQDSNAEARLMVGAQVAFPGCSPQFCPIHAPRQQDDRFDPTLPLALNIVDIHVRARGLPLVIVANAAPRGGKAQETWTNGTPFGYVRVGSTLVVGTIDGFTFSALRKCFGVETVEVIDLAGSLGMLDGIPEPTKALLASGDHQFRSGVFEIDAAAAIWAGVELPTQEEPYPVPVLPDSALHRDGFGNAKLPYVAEDVGHEPGRTLYVCGRPVTCYASLRRIPNGELGLVPGSSGLPDRPFLELQKSGGDAAAEFRLVAGVPVNVSGGGTRAGVMAAA